MTYKISEKFKVDRKKCIVTGGAQGLSRGMAESLLENGAEVVLMDLQKDKLQKVVDEYNKKGFKAHAIFGDLSKKSEIDRMFDEAMSYLDNELNVLIPAAGIQRRHAPWEFPEDEWRLVIDINLNHVWFMAQKAIQKMKDGKTTGKIITIGSMVSWFGGTTVPAYTAAKGAVTQLTKSIASDCAAHNICCNGLAPGYMDTEMNVGLTEERRKEISERIPAIRWGLPEDMKGPVLFLASDASNYLNGTMIPVDGGYLVR